MYPSLKDVRQRRRHPGCVCPLVPLCPETNAHRKGPWWRPAVTANVVFLGFTSLFTDVSSEMVNSVVPLFLAFQLGFTRFEFGVFNGAFQGLAAFTALSVAGVADRHRRYKEIAGIGYGVSAATRIGLVAAGTSWLPVTGLLYADRGAKGIRTAPRDALISLSALPGHLGEAFGVHRAMDTAGALAGPLVAFGLLSLVPGAYETIFSASFWIALIGLACLILFVQNRKPILSALETRTGSLRTAMGLLHIRDFRNLVIAGSAFSMVTIADALVYLTLQQRTTMSLRFFPLLYVGAAASYLLLAIPLGRFADRVGPARVFLAGEGLLVLVDVLLIATHPGVVGILVMLAVLGAYYAATDGILATVASAILPEEHRTNGLALLGTAMALAAFAASAVFGAVWGWWGPSLAVGIFLAGLLGSLALGALLLRPLLRAQAA